MVYARPKTSMVSREYPQDSFGGFLEEMCAPFFFLPLASLCVEGRISRGLEWKCHGPKSANLVSFTQADSRVTLDFDAVS